MLFNHFLQYRGREISGNELTYTITTHPKNSKNKVTINMATGVIQIKAERNDFQSVALIIAQEMRSIGNDVNAASIPIPTMANILFSIAFFLVFRNSFVSISLTSMNSKF